MQGSVYLRAACPVLFVHALALAAIAGSPANDNCEDAILIQPGLIDGTTIGATPDGEAISNDCPGTGASPDVWYAYSPLEDCQLDITTCGTASWDTTLSVHGSCPGTQANELTCNDDTCGTQSRVVISATAETSYYIRVSGWQGAQGDFSLSVSCTAPAADTCTDATPIGEASVTGNTSANTSDGSASCGDSADSPDAWYEFAAAEDCLLTVEACGSDYDTVLSIHDSCPGTEDNELSCNDDACSATRSVVSTPVTGGSSYFIRVSGWQGATGTFDLSANCTISSGAPDAYANELHAFQQFGRDGAYVGCALDLTICNVGGSPLDYYANPNPHHPFYTFNMYRLLDDRLEQIGQMWVKHSWASDTANACGLGCNPPGNNQQLGVGCSDTYGVTSQAIQSVLGPRSEIDPWTGAYQYEGSHLDVTSGPHGPVDHRLRLHDDDLDAALNVGAAYICEFHTIAHDDLNHMNNVSHEPVIVDGEPGGTWTFDIGGANSVNGPAIESWPGALQTTIPAEPTSDGRCILAAKVTPVDAQTWHYEYALYNHDMARGVGAFTVPVPSDAAVSNIGFSSAPADGDVHDESPWIGIRVGSSITWSTEPFVVDPLANSLRWGTLYNFRFDADVAPVNGFVCLQAFEPGSPSEYCGIARTPGVGVPPAPLPGGFGACLEDSDCVNESSCIDGICYAPKNRYVSIAPHAVESGITTARRVSMDPGTGDLVTLGWLSPPDADSVSRLVASPGPSEYREWGPDGVIQLADCAISPAHEFLIQSIAEGADIADESNYSAPVILPTVAIWGDVSGSISKGVSLPPDAIANFIDIQGVVLGFQNMPTAPLSWLDLDGEIPNLQVNFADILNAVHAFQQLAYPYDDPCSCAGLQPCP